MNEWMPLWTTALGGIIATLSGVVSPAIAKGIDHRRSDRLDQVARRRAVAQRATDFVVAKRELSQKLIGMTEAVPEGQPPKFPEVSREDHRAFVDFVMSAEFDAPDTQAGCNALVEACDALLERIRQYQVAFWGGHEQVGLRQLQEEFVRDHGLLLDKMDEAYRLLLVDLAKSN